MRGKNPHDTRFTYLPGSLVPPGVPPDEGGVVLQTGGYLLFTRQDLRSRHRGHPGRVAGMIDAMNRALGRGEAF